MKHKLNPDSEDVLKKQDLVLELEDVEIDENFVSDWEYNHVFVLKNKNSDCIKTKPIIKSK